MGGSVTAGSSRGLAFATGFLVHFHRKLVQTGRIIFKAVERLQILTRVESFPAVRFVMSTLSSRRENSTILEGPRHGTAHIIEGTCSQA